VLLQQSEDLFEMTGSAHRKSMAQARGCGWLSWPNADDSPGAGESPVGAGHHAGVSHPGRRSGPTA